MTKFFGKLAATLEIWIGSLHIVSGAAILVIMFAYFALILGRWLRFEVTGAFELQEILLVVCVFLGLAYTEIKGQNIRIRILTGHIPWLVEELMSVLVLLIAIGFMAFAVSVNTRFAMEMYRAGEYRTGAIAFPIWPFRMVIAFGWILMIVVLVIKVLRESGRIRDHFALRGLSK